MVSSRRWIIVLAGALVASCSSAPEVAPPPGTISGANALLLPSPGVFPTPVPVPTPVAPSASLATSQAFSSILAGGNYGTRDGHGEEAQFVNIGGIALDLDGGLLVADAGAHAIRKVSMAGDVSTIVGSGRYGKADGKAREATFRGPKGIAIDRAGNMYVADTDNHRIRKVTQNGDVLTLTRTRGWYASPDDGLQYDFEHPNHIVADPDGTVYVSDASRQLFRISPEGQIAIHFDGHRERMGTSWKESYSFRIGVMLLDTRSRLQFADVGNGSIWTILGSGAAERALGATGGPQGFLDGDRSVARIGGVTGMASDPDGNLYFNDASNWSIRVMSKDGYVRTLIGDGNRGNILGIPTEARLGGLGGLVYGRDGHLYVAEPGNRRILKVSLR